MNMELQSLDEMTTFVDCPVCGSRAVCTQPTGQSEKISCYGCGYYRLIAVELDQTHIHEEKGYGAYRLEYKDSPGIGEVGSFTTPDSKQYFIDEVIKIKTTIHFASYTEFVCGELRETVLIDPTNREMDSYFYYTIEPEETGSVLDQTYQSGKILIYSSDGEEEVPIGEGRYCIPYEVVSHFEAFIEGLLTDLPLFVSFGTQQACDKAAAAPLSFSQLDLYEDQAPSTSKIRRRPSEFED